MERSDGQHDELATTNAALVLEWSEEPWETDSAVGDLSSLSSCTTSLTPSVMDYKYENGRRYHAYKEGTYALPNDDEELSRLDLQHHLWRLTLDGELYIAPIPHTVSNVLDLGTGTGIWAIEFADAHPNATVIGTDLSPVQPAFTPVNCHFVVDDVESNWTFAKNYDFIHSRFIVMGVRDWPRYFRQSFDHLRPSGYIEVQEGNLLIDCDDGSWGEGKFVRNLFDDCAVAATKMGLPVRGVAGLGAELEKVGFRDVQLRRYRWPIGTWSSDDKEKTLGAWAKRDVLEGVQGLAMAFLTRTAGLTREEVELRLVDVRKELNDPEVHQYINLYIWYAQKPESADEEQI